MRWNHPRRYKTTINVLLITSILVGYSCKKNNMLDGISAKNVDRQAGNISQPRNPTNQINHSPTLAEETPSPANTPPNDTPITTSEPQINVLLDDLSSYLSSLQPGDKQAIAPAFLVQFLEMVWNKQCHTIDKASSQCYIAYAIAYKSIPLLELTLAYLQGDINEPYEGGLTFLHYASYFGNLNAIDLLLSKGARKDVPTQKDWKIGNLVIRAGSTAYDIALQLNRQAAAERLRP